MGGNSTMAYTRHDATYISKQCIFFSCVS